jgi:hypothetical protein
VQKTQETREKDRARAPLVHKIMKEICTTLLLKTKNTIAHRSQCLYTYPRRVGGIEHFAVLEGVKTMPEQHDLDLQLRLEFRST